MLLCGNMLQRALRAEEVEFKIKFIMCHSEFNHTPWNTAAWQAENARMCLFNVAWLHRPMEYVHSADIAYPEIPWYPLAKPGAMARFFRYARAEEDAVRAASTTAPSVAVCITGETFPSFWWEVTSAVTQGLGHRDKSKVKVFAAVLRQDCPSAVKLLDPNLVRCLDDEPFRSHGNIPARYARHFVRQYRLQHACLDMALSQGAFDWILAKRSEVFLREFPSTEVLAEAAVFTAAQSTNRARIFDDKLFLARPTEVRHVAAASRFMARLANVSAQPAPASRRFSGLLNANATRPAAILQRFLAQQGVALRPLAQLRYEELRRRRATQHRR